MIIGKQAALYLIASLVFFSSNTCAQSGRSNMGAVQPRISIGLLDGSRPWVVNDEPYDQRVSGIFADNLRMIFHSIALEPHFTIYQSYPRIMHELSGGRLAMAAAYRGVGIAPPDIASITCTESNFTQATLAMFSKVNTQVPITLPLEKLTKYRVATVRILDLEYLKPFSKKNIYQLRNTEGLVRLLMAGRVEFVIMAERSAEYWSQQYSVEIKKIHEFGKISAHLCLSYAALGELRADKIKKQLENRMKTLGADHKISQLESQE